VTGPRFWPAQFPTCVDIAKVNGYEARGERIIVAGYISDADGRPVPHTMVEIWQANAADRYPHERDRHDAPLEPHFRGVGRVFSDEAGRYPLHHDQAGRLSLAQPPQRLAAQSHPLLAFRAGLRDAAGDADVLPRRSAAAA
jgi:hypothetical protein